MQTDLIEYLQIKTDCDYISDLPKLARNKDYRLIDVLKSIKPDDFPLKQWNNAIVYLLHTSSTCNTGDEARALLISRLYGSYDPK